MSYEWIVVLSVIGVLAYAGIYFYYKYSNTQIIKPYKREIKIEMNYLSKLTNGYTEGWEQDYRPLPNGRILVRFAPTDIDDGQNPADFIQDLILLPGCRKEVSTIGKGKKKVIYFSPFESDYEPDQYIIYKNMIDDSILKSRTLDILKNKQIQNIKTQNRLIKETDYEAPVGITELYKEASKRIIEMQEVKKKDIPTRPRL